MQTSFNLLANTNTKFLILGSFPGQQSLLSQQYYANAQNHFWKILKAIFPLPGQGVKNYEQKTSWLLDLKLGLWDVFARCDRVGSLDANIKNAALNDFSLLLKFCPHLEHIGFNGKTSFSHREKLSSILPVKTIYLPSSSSANASYSLEEKIKIWRQAFQSAQLL